MEEESTELFEHYMVGKIIVLSKKNDDTRKICGVLRGFFTDDEEQLHMHLDGIGDVVITDPATTVLEVYGKA